MPSRNIIRQDIEDSYYHVYLRGASKQKIYLDQADKQKFISLFARYLSKKKVLSSMGVAYPNYRGSIDLLAYCFMDNHFHLFIHQEKKGDLTKFMRSMLTSYVRYFN